MILRIFELPYLTSLPSYQDEEGPAGKCLRIIAITLRNLLNRRFVASRPNQLWVADIAYVPTWSGFARAVLTRRCPYGSR